MIDQLRTMAIFANVVEAGSFRAAAKALNLSPSVVSHHISQLEDRLGTALLYRSTRKISLTDDGAALFEASGHMVAAAQAGLEALQKRSDQPAGRLRIAVAGAVFENPPYIDHLIDFAKRYPKIELSISFSDQDIELIGSAFDVAIRVRAGRLEDSRYKARKLSEIERVLIAAPSYLAGKAMPKSVTDLDSWDWIKLAQFTIAQQLMNKQGEVPKISPTAIMEVDSVAALCQMVRAGLGIACVPRQLVRQDLRAGRLIAIVPNWPLLAPGAYAIWPNNVSRDSLTLRFVSFMAARLKGA
jgi:DNA-binding transcriptional LysR family regulator